MDRRKFILVSALMLGLHILVYPNGSGMPFGNGTLTAQSGPCPLRGSCNLEPGLQGRTDLLLFEDFEASNWQSHFTEVDHTENWSTVTTQFFQGTRGLELRAPSGQHYGGSFYYDFTDAGLADPEEMYFRYYIRFNDTWQRNSDGEIGKLPGFDGAYGSPAGHGCTASNGSNGWSARMMNWDRGSTNQVGFYAYHADMSGSCGEHMAWPGNLERNRWYSIEARVRLNTITGGRGNNDGILQGWVDDQLVFTRTNLRFRDVPNLKLEKIWGNTYVGGSWSADRNMSLHYDNMVIARNKIGAAGQATPPRPPTNVRIIR